MEKLEISRNGFNSWTLWKIVEDLEELKGSISIKGIFSGAKKECQEEKNRLEGLENGKRKRRNFKKN